MDGWVDGWMVQIQGCIFSSFIVDIGPASQGCHLIAINIVLDFFYPASHICFKIQKFKFQKISARRDLNPQAPGLDPMC